VVSVLDRQDTKSNTRVRLVEAPQAAGPRPGGVPMVDLPGACPYGVSRVSMLVLLRFRVRQS
jgi:hypothetical protein